MVLMSFPTSTPTLITASTEVTPQQDLTITPLQGLLDHLDELRYVLDTDRAWFDGLIDLVVGCPDTAAAVSLAHACSLSIAKRLTRHHDRAVRQALCRNPLVVDVDLQVALAGDPDEQVVLALLDAVDPYVETCEAIIDGPHPAARRILAHRPLTDALLGRLADDPHPVVAAQARLTLAERADRNPRAAHPKLRLVA